MADDLSDQDIFDSTELSEDEVGEKPTPKAEEGTPERPRDEQGRFASKEEKKAEPEAPQPQEKAQEPTQQQPVTEEPKSEPSNVPPGLLEERRRRQEAEQRAQTIERQLQEQARQLAQMQGYLQGQQRQEQPKPEQPPDMFVDPDGYMAFQRKQIEAQLLTPIQQQMMADREYWSARNAERDFGSETVKAARTWLEDSVRSGDTEAHAVWQRALQDRDPYGTIVRHYQQRQTIQQVGSDPLKWFEKTLEEKLADPTFQQQIAQKLGPVSSRQAPPTFMPSINRASGSAATPADSVPGTEEELFQAAPRRMGRRD